MKEKIKAILQSFVKPFDIGIGLPYWHVIEADKINEISEEISKALPQLYSIKPLEWEKDEVKHSCRIAHVYYYITLFHSELRIWNLFVEVDGKNRRIECNSLEQAKSKAQEDWNNRISQYLTEYKEGK